MEINPASWKTKPFKHQIIGVKFILENPVGAVLDEMGSGKTKQFIDAACILFESRKIDTVLVVAPSPVKSTWADHEAGEIVTHCWVPSYIEEFNGRNTKLRSPDINSHLHWIITNYEFIRLLPRLTLLQPQLKNRQLMIVFDESSYIKSHRAAQTKASRTLRNLAKRAYLANGSPINNSLIDLYAPFAILNKNIIGSPNWWAFRNRYCKMGGYQNKQIVGYDNVEELQKRIAPYAIRRLKEDCLDLPPKLYNIAEVPLCPETWRIYKEMRDEMISWLDTQTPIITLSAIVKIVRLSQLTSGMIGGLNRAKLLAANMGLNTELPFEEQAGEDVVDLMTSSEDIRIISSEKHDYAAQWFKERAAEQSNFRAILWTRFRKEQEQIADRLLFAKVMRIFGGQKKSEREDVLRKFNQPDRDPVVLLGQPKAGGIGLNLQAECNWAVYVSNDYSLLSRLQSEDRIHRSGQKASTVNYLDILATGPNGQKTVDHAIRRSLKNKEEFAFKTTAYWRAALKEE